MVRPLAEGRLGEPPDRTNQEYILKPVLRAELDQLPIFLEVDLAHCLMLIEQGVIERSDGERLLAALLRLADQPDLVVVDPEFDTLLLQVERALAAEVGEDVAGRLHTGRSRNDQGSTVDRIYTRDALLETLADLEALERVVLSLAERHVETVMPGYTHLQHAQPTTFAHYLVRHAATFERDQQRIRQAFERVNLSPLGLAAMAGTSWPLNRDRTAGFLGFDGLVVTGQDAGIFNTDYPAEVAAVLSIHANDIARVAIDLYIWSTYEFRMVEIPDGLAGTSSIMPQKKNAHSLERTMSLGGGAIGWLASVLGTVRGTSSDLGFIFGSGHLGAMFDETRAAARLLTATLEGLSVKTDVMAERAGANWTTASNLADTLVRRAGIPFRSAHQVVGRVVRRAIEAGKTPADVTADDIRTAALETIDRPIDLDADAVHEALDPRAFVASRATPGSPRPDDVRDQIAALSAREADHRAWLGAKTDQIAASRRRLREAAAASASARTG
ncbi:MAG TPA: argininosuccinate lyase [Candidatus Limnocylindrales bacterium]|nr:argininosuccinate lyase [Candidatus Limnocylindrales bacterium]